MPVPRVNSSRSSVGAALACYFSACLHLLSVSIILKALELSERVVASMLALIAVSDRGGRGVADRPGEAHCDNTQQSEGVYGVHEVRSNSEFG